MIGVMICAMIIICRYLGRYYKQYIMVVWCMSLVPFSRYMVGTTMLSDSFSPWDSGFVNIFTLASTLLYYFNEGKFGNIRQIKKYWTLFRPTSK